TLLEAYGVPVVAERVVGTVEAAVAAAGELGYPVVVKSAAAGVHKTESGGVAVNLGEETEVRAAVDRIGLPVLVQPMIRGGAELDLNPVLALADGCVAVDARVRVARQAPQRRAKSW